jgi:hypothetical protein
MITSEDGKNTPQLDEDNNPIVVEVGSKLGTSKTLILEDLMMKLEKLNVENKRLKAKGKRATTYSSSSEDGDSSFEEGVSNKGRKRRNKHDKPSYNSMSFNYNSMSNYIAYTSIPIGKTPCFDESNYNQ